MSGGEKTRGDTSGFQPGEGRTTSTKNNNYRGSYPSLSQERQENCTTYYSFLSPFVCRHLETVGTDLERQRGSIDLLFFCCYNVVALPSLRRTSHCCWDNKRREKQVSRKTYIFCCGRPGFKQQDRNDWKKLELSRRSKINTKEGR